MPQNKIHPIFLTSLQGKTHVLLLPSLLSYPIVDPWSPSSCIGAPSFSLSWTALLLKKQCLRGLSPQPLLWKQQRLYLLCSPTLFSSPCKGATVLLPCPPYPAREDLTLTSHLGPKPCRVFSLCELVLSVRKPLSLAVLHIALLSHLAAVFKWRTDVFHVTFLLEVQYLSNFYKTTSRLFLPTSFQKVIVLSTSSAALLPYTGIIQSNFCGFPLIQ